MKRIKTSFLLLGLLAFSLSFQSCRTMVNLRWPAQAPPAVSLPEHVQSVGIINRSLATEGDGSKVFNVIEGVITGEGIFEDKNGSFAALAGAEIQLNMDNLVAATRFDSLLLPGTGTGAQPLPLGWDEVKKICDRQKVDALLVLEVFDTDQTNTVSSNAVNQIRSITESGRPAPIVTGGNQRIRLKLAWRFYDPTDRIFLDDVRMNDYFGVNTHPFDLGEFGKRDAIQQSAYIAGRAYGSRLFPTTYYIHREFYQRKGQDMKTARRMVDVNDWDGAMDMWQQVIRTSKRKTAGRACYNMAIAHEVIGDIPVAIEWAEKAWTVYREKRARDYARLLKRRL